MNRGGAEVVGPSATDDGFPEVDADGLAGADVSDVVDREVGPSSPPHAETTTKTMAAARQAVAHHFSMESSGLAACSSVV